MAKKKKICELIVSVIGLIANRKNVCMACNGLHHLWILNTGLKKEKKIKTNILKYHFFAV